MATPATARRGEPTSSKLQADLEAHHSPHRAAQQPTSRTATPRPSISPLSTTSKPNRSPDVTRDMATTATMVQQDTEVEPAVDTAAVEVGEPDDDRSSSLSEPEDDEDEQELHNGAKEDSKNGEQLTAQRSLEEDSEAETERLDQTPHKQRQQAEETGKTPSKLSQAATAEEELSEPPSPLPIGPGAASSTSTVATAGVKRKRSDTAESPLTSAESDLEESPRKRNQQLAHEDEEEVTEANGAVEDAPEPIDDTPAPEEARATPIAVSLLKGAKGKKSKLKGKKAKEPVQDADTEYTEDTGDTAREPSEEMAAKSEAERQQKAQALPMFELAMKQFHACREKMYDERLTTMNTELELLNRPECEHPEYLRQVACVKARRDKQLREAQAYYHYRLRSVQQRVLGDRSQLHSQYFQRIREVREEVMYSLGEDWYNIQKERRQQHQDKDDAYIYKFPTKRSEQIKRQAKYNQEVSVLSGVAKYVGFPAAPNVNGAEGADLEGDLKAMKIAKRVHAPAPSQHQQEPIYQRIPNVSATNEQLAHRQWEERNAWAQPQRPIHTHGTPNLTHTDNWAEQPVQHNAARNLIRNLSGHMPRTGSPYATPLPQKRQPLPEHSGSRTVPASGSDDMEPPSSVLAAPPTSDRISFIHHLGGTPQPSPLHVSKQRQPNGGAPERELTGFRNISNISGVSGASTIDAPPDSIEKDRREREPRPQLEHNHQEGRQREPDHEAVPAPKALPALLTEASAPLQHFETSQFHRQEPHRQLDHRHDERDRERGSVYANVGFRPQEGAFGTPAPLSTATATSAAP